MEHNEYINFLREKYNEEVEETFLEFRELASGKDDMNRLGELLSDLMHSAVEEGLTEEEFEDILASVLPEETWKRIDLAA